MIGNAPGGRCSIAATVSAAAIATAIAEGTGVAGAIVFARLGIGFTTGIDRSPIQDRHHGRDDHNHPENHLAHILAPSAVDTLKGNRR